LETPELDSILQDVGVGDLEIDLPDDFTEEDMPHLVAAEEIIHEGFLNVADDKAADVVSNNTSVNRLKSQAQSTYMLEKHLEIANKPPKNRKSSAGSGRAFQSVGKVQNAPGKVSKALQKQPPSAKPVKGFKFTLIVVKNFKSSYFFPFRYVV